MIDLPVAVSGGVGGVAVATQPPARGKAAPAARPAIPVITLRRDSEWLSAPAAWVLESECGVGRDIGVLGMMAAEIHDMNIHRTWVR